MELRKPEIKYSDPVEDIMGNPPGRILRWGSMTILIVFVLFLFLTWLINYPDVIPSTVEITTENPPVTLVSRINGSIKHLRISDKDKVQKDQVLAVMETAASYDEIVILKTFADSATHLQSMPNNSIPQLDALGELQTYYGSFRKALSDYNNFLTNDYYGNKIESVKVEIRGINNYISRLKESEKLYSENLELDLRRFRRDSLLFIADRTIPPGEYEKSRQALIRQRLDLQDIRIQLSAKSAEQQSRQQDLKDYTIQRSEGIEKLASSLEESFRNLKAQIRIWEISYLLISPVSGTVTFTKYWRENQSVNKDEPVLTIVPWNQGKFIGRIFLKMQRSGKVKIHQRVNIKLSGFPYLEYGMVRGEVMTKSLVPSGDAYVIEIALPDGLKTLYNKQLEFTQNMQGTAEIITENRRLLQRIIDPFKYLFSKNKK
jgi:multidrug efflux pump subunit AcrA (membrane-fusion protein)